MLADIEATWEEIQHKSNLSEQLLALLNKSGRAKRIGTFDEQSNQANARLLGYIGQSEGRQNKRDSLATKTDACRLARACFS